MIGNGFLHSNHIYGYKLGSPSMIYGNDMVVNVEMLSDSSIGLDLDFIEILLFHTPDLHNIPTTQELQRLKEIKDDSLVNYTVHLPASLEIASTKKEVRDKSIQLILDIWQKFSTLQPAHYILHIPITQPTLVADPGQYFKTSSSQAWGEWTSRAMESLKLIQGNGCDINKLLVENINYSPRFLEPFFDQTSCGFCLDIGHLLLGDERVGKVLKRYLGHIREIHLHGVEKYLEHLSLDVLPSNRVSEWFSCLHQSDYQGLINLEVFSPKDLQTSVDLVSRLRDKACIYRG